MLMFASENLKVFKDPIAEDPTRSGHRMWKNETRTDLEAFSTRSDSHRTRVCLAVCPRRKAINKQGSCAVAKGKMVSYSS